MADPGGRSVVRVAWAIVLLLTIPEIVLGAFLQVDLWWMTGARIALLGGFVALTFAWPTIRALRGMLVVFLVIYGVEGWLFLTVLPGTPAYVDAVAGDATRALFAERLSRLGAVAVMIVVLLAMGMKRRDFYLAVGDVRATAATVRALGPEAAGAVDEVRPELRHHLGRLLHLSRPAPAVPDPGVRTVDRRRDPWHRPCSRPRVRP